MLTTQKYMKMALRCAKKGIGGASPNPCVGAVLVKNNKVLAKGYHKQYGQAHAERNAINACKAKGLSTKGADIYVTLEPCNHTGKQPPCTEAIIEAGIQRVFYAMADINPTSGDGFKTLKKAGIEVHGPILENEAQALNQAFITGVQKKRPYVVAKWAMGLDGHIATKTGDSSWVSGDDSRYLVHQIRASVDAILIGAQTARKDKPTLTCRELEGPNPIRVILDPQLSIAKNAALLQDGEAPTLIFCSAQGLQKSVTYPSRPGVEYISAPCKGSKLNVEAVLSCLYKRGIRSVLVEGGGAIHGSFFDAKVVDEVFTFIAPIIIGGQCAPAAVGGVGPSKMLEKVTLQNIERHQLGEDILIRATVGEHPLWSALDF